MIFAGIYYSTQRLCKARLPSRFLSAFHFYGWQSIIVAAAVTLPLGYTQGKEYAELEWPIDIAIALVWVAFAINFFWTLNNRREKHLYVALWFYIATILTVAVLHIVNSLALPVFSGLKSYSIYAGVQDALVQWWYGHNAVAFFLTTPVPRPDVLLPAEGGRTGRSFPTGSRSFIFGRSSSFTSGPDRITCSTPRCPTGRNRLGMVFSLMLVGAVVGRHVERVAHAARRVGIGCAKIRCSSSLSQV